ncbi:SRPBCC domain-containing protein [Cystobacter fuscus]|jgi:uncharacterized protein YndB with AHSA1/START domain|uniref:SRPBCC family protein n=1 Tax=Cystobacter fuscus TaxID=43 RepID=UPI002B2CB841|nr:SRPBCC domain-containing protein [Cystobacter fuscus]
MTSIQLVRDYPHPPSKVWRALTDPALMARWLVAAKPEGFTTHVGTRFKFVGKPKPGWSGIVECELLEAREPSSLRYSWLADGGEVMQLSYHLEPHEGGTRLRFEQSGFKGVGGVLLAKLVMAPIRKQMFGPRMLAVLDDLSGTMPMGSPLQGDGLSGPGNRR